MYLSFLLSLSSLKVFKVRPEKLVVYRDCFGYNNNYEGGDTMINRPGYIAAIAPFIDQPLVKILAGVRRCGKSTIFEMLKEEFLPRRNGR